MTEGEAALPGWFRILRGLPPDELMYMLAGLTVPARRALAEFWPGWAHTGQLPPSDFAVARGRIAWRVWLMLAGRGFGKTRAGAEWVSEMARLHPDARIALVGASLAEVERVMIGGESGLRAVSRAHEDFLYYPSRQLVEFASGAKAYAYSGAHPDGLRGPEHHFAWCDELAKWRHPEESWSNLMLGLRLGDAARVLVTTTPRSLALLKQLRDDPETKVATGRTAANPHLPDSFVADVTARYAGTRLARQELEGELIEDIDGALWTRAGLERWRAAPILPGEGLKRVLIGVDPPASATGDACGIVACGLGADGVCYVLADHSVRGLGPEGWARAVAGAAEAWGAERVIAETNQGGEMVAAVLRSADVALPVRGVVARFGKGRRAEPVAALFETGKARLAGVFDELEEELCGMTAGGYERPGHSPDRADAMVWAMAELALGPRGEPRVRQL